MGSLLNIVYYVVPFIVLLGILVFVHEFGHFLIARMCGVKVTDFSIGFGKQLWGFVDKHQTNWKICAIPLGGYCQFLGDANGASAGGDDTALKELTEEEKSQAFAFQNPWKKLAIVLGGPGFNYLFAILLFTGMFMTFGNITFPPVVGEVMDDGPAKAAGILPGDRIVNINGREIKSFNDIGAEITLSTKSVAKIELLRDGETIYVEVPLKTMTVEEDGIKEKRQMIGIKSRTSVELDHERLSPWGALCTAGSETWRITTGTLRGIKQMIVGDRGTEDLGGIIRIAEMSGDISRKHAGVEFLVFMALLSINLGLINLFPIPVLDGGHVVIFLLEIISRREMNEKLKEALFKCGFALLIALMVFATWNDFVHLFKRWFV